MKIIDIPQSVLRYLDLATKPAEWVAPEPIGKKLLPVPELDSSMLPPLLMAAVKDISERMQASKEYVAVPMLCALGAVIGTGCAIRPKVKDNWTIVPNIWGAIVGPPTSKKSPAMSSGIEPIRHLDALAQKDFEAAEAQVVLQQFTNDMRVEELKKKSKSGKLSPDEVKELAFVSRKLVPPPCKRYYTNDATIESLGEILANNPRGVLMVNDELTSWLQNMEKAGREGSRGAYLTSWNGLDPQRVDRVSRGNIYIPRFCVSVLGGIQPDMLQTYMAEAQDEGRNDGLVQRLQMAVYPDMNAINHIEDRQPDQAVMHEIRVLFEKLSGDLHGYQPLKDAPDGIPYFRFESKKAAPLFKSWLLGIETRARTEENPVMAEHLGKYGRLVPALSLIFHLTLLATSEKKPGSPISIDSLNMAIKWAEFLEPHARRIYGMAQNKKTVAAAALIKKIQEGKVKSGFKARGLAVNGWARLDNVDAINEALRELEDANWIRKEKPKVKSGAGRPSSPSFEINPAALTSIAGGDPAKPTKSPRLRKK